MTDTDLKKKFAIKLSVMANTILIVIKLIAAFFTGSIGIFSEAIHSGIDLAASVVAYFSIKQAAIPADTDHHYGHGKYEDISGFAEAALISLAALIILNEAVIKLIHLEKFTIKVDVGIAIMILSVVVYIVISQYLFKIAKETDSTALYADARHLQTDIITSLGVLSSLVIIKLTGFSWIDPVVAIGIAALISYMAYKIAKQSINNLVDVALPKDEEEQIRQIVANYFNEIRSIHGFCCRKSGTIRFIDFHLMIPGDITVKQGHMLCDQIEEDINKLFPNTRVTIHVEPCINDCLNCHVQETDNNTCKKLLEKI